MPPTFSSPPLPWGSECAPASVPLQKGLSAAGTPTGTEADVRLVGWRRVVFGGVGADTAHTRGGSEGERTKSRRRVERQTDRGRERERGAHRS